MQVPIFNMTVPALRKAYDKAVANGLDQFEFQGQQFLTSYAKYMLEYLEGQARV